MTEEVEFTVTTDDGVMVIEVGATPSSTVLGTGVKGDGTPFMTIGTIPLNEYAVTGEEVSNRDHYTAHTVILFKSEKGIDVLERAITRIREGLDHASE